MELKRYTRTAMILHWLIALGIIVNVGIGWSLSFVPRTSILPLIYNHKSIGITVLGLAILRLLWRLTHTPPPLPTTYQRWEQVASHWVHMLLYAVIFAMPLSGWIMDSAYKNPAAYPNHYFGTFEWPRIGFIMHLDPVTKLQIDHLFVKVHASCAYVLYALFVLHIAGALKHQFLDREKELERMVPSRRPAAPEGAIADQR